MDLLFRPMTRDDVPRVGDILHRAFNAVAVKHGFPQKIITIEKATAWAWSIMSYDSAIKLVAQIDGCVVGITCLNPRGKLGGMGPTAIDPDYKYGLTRKPVGYLLAETMLKNVEKSQSIRYIQEAFNTASFHKGYSLGFLPVETLLHLTFAKSFKDKWGSSEMVTEASLDDLDDLSKFDEPRSSMQRKGDFVFYKRWGRIFINKKDNAISGFLVCLPGSDYVQLGPMMADGEDQAIDLFRKALKVFGKRIFHTRTMAGNVSLNETLMKWGFRIESIDLLFVRGNWRPGKGVEAFGMFPEGV